MPDFNESNLELFETCLSLLVKIEEDKSDLIQMFLDRFKYLINKKFDEIFGIREGVTEIDFLTYAKIYDNYEFAINENEFLFYENQIENSETSEKFSSSSSLILNPRNIRTLSSKFFKKGTYIWICKKILENIINNFLYLIYKSFNNLFEKKNTHVINLVYNHIIELFNKKINDLIEKSNSKFKLQINSQGTIAGILCDPDPIFFKEGILSFYFSFSESLQKISSNDDNINSKELLEKILNFNKILTEKYVKNLEFFYIHHLSEYINQGVKNMLEKNKNKSLFVNFDSFFIDNNLLFSKLTNFLHENLIVLKKLDLGELYNTKSDENYCNKIYLNEISKFLNLFYYVLKSTNTLKFDNLRIDKSNLSIEDFSNMRKKINEFFENVSKERIYTKIILCKIPVMTQNNSNNPGIKIYLDKILKDFSNLKNNKTFYNEIKSLIERETSETLSSLFDSLVQLQDREIYEKINFLFYREDWLNYESAVTFRLPLRNLCYDLFLFKNELYTLLDEEKKVFDETNSSSLNEALLWNKKQKRLSKYQKEMECLHIRRLSIYSMSNSPQAIMLIIAKIFLKVCNIIYFYKNVLSF
jgi:hypothetical protein